MGLVKNHMVCYKSIGHDMAPKIFWGPNGPGAAF